MLGCQHEIPFVLAVLIINDDDEPSGPESVECLWDGGELGQLDSLG
jgi:hypothetical protein